MNEITIRKLEPSDERIIYEWISSPNLRKMTGTRGIPNLEGHSKWFQNKIDDKCNCIQIIEYVGMPVGIIGTNHIDIDNKNAEIYLYIGSDLYRRKGIGSTAITLFLKLLRSRYDTHKVYARVFSFNIPSIRLFEKMGFVLEGNLKDRVYVADEEKHYDLLWYGFLLEEK